MRWLVGDVQGCARELEELLKLARFDEHRDELWCLGDLINRGPHSLETLRLWRAMGGKGVLGNHDVYALRVRAGTLDRKESDTLDALFAAPDADELLDALLALPVLAHLPCSTGPSAWAVHAGLHPQWNDLKTKARELDRATRDEEFLAREDVAFSVNVRCCKPDGERCLHKGGPEGCVPPCRPWDDYYQGDTLVVHGHWAWRGPYRTRRSLGLDGACVHGGHLIAWCQDEDRIVKVKSKSA